jgi:hypothetical protein
MRLQSRAKERIEKENLLSNGSFLWWGADLLDCLLSLVCHGLGVFSSGEEGREDVRCEWICRATKGAILLAVRAHWE